MTAHWEQNPLAAVPRNVSVAPPTIAARRLRLRPGKGRNIKHAELKELRLFTFLLALRGLYGRSHVSGLHPETSSQDQQ